MKEKTRKAYRKPVLERVVLVPEENVLAVCYDLTGSGVFGNSLCQAGAGTGCFGVTLDVGKQAP